MSNITDLIRASAAPVAARESVASGRLVENVIFPDGACKSDKGSFVFDRESADLVLAAFEAADNALVVDYEHQSSRGMGHESPHDTGKAAGWIEALRYEPGRGLVASVNWTVAARDLIRADKYRYMSPEFYARRSDKKIVRLCAVGLTNRPAMHHLEKVAASLDATPTEHPNDTEVDHIMTEEAKAKAIELKKQIATALGMDPDASLLDVLTKALAALKADGDGDAQGDNDKQVAATVRDRLGLAEGANTDAVLHALSTGAFGSGVADDLAELVTLRTKTADLEFEAVCREHCGKLDGYHAFQHGREMLRRVYDRDDTPDKADFHEVLRVRCPMPPQGRTTAPHGGPRRVSVRDSEIRQAVEEFRADPKLAKQTDVDAYVNQALREQAMPTLGSEELATYM